LYTDYELRQRPNGHYDLFRPERQWRYFTPEAYYRITPGRPTRL
jgi:hypothetical protein